MGIFLHCYVLSCCSDPPLPLSSASFPHRLRHIRNLSILLLRFIVLRRREGSSGRPSVTKGTGSPDILHPLAVSFRYTPSFFPLPPSPSTWVCKYLVFSFLVVLRALKNARFSRSAGCGLRPLRADVPSLKTPFLDRLTPVSALFLPSFPFLPSPTNNQFLSRASLLFSGPFYLLRSFLLVLFLLMPVSFFSSIVQ